MNILRLIKSHFRLHKLPVLIFLGISLLTIIWFTCAGLLNFKNFFIATTGSVYDPGETIQESVGDLSYQLDTLFSFMSLVYFLALIIVLTYLILVSEISSGKISYWASLPISRSELILSKKLFITLITFLGWLPLLIYGIIFSSISVDSSKYAQYVYADLFQFLIFLILLENIIFFVSLLLANNKKVFFIVILILSFYLLITEYAIMMTKNALFPDKFLEFLTYIAVKNLMTSFLVFANNNSIIIHNGKEYITFEHVNVNLTKFVICLITQLILIPSLMVGNVYVFKSKNLTY